ncbi:unnamed protein product, partial [Arabidopsis halleri]
EHSGPEPWANQTVGTIPLLQPTGATHIKHKTLAKKRLKNKASRRPVVGPKIKNTHLLILSSPPFAFSAFSRLVLKLQLSLYLKKPKTYIFLKYCKIVKS